MADISLTTFSDGLADAVERAGARVVQVQGRRTPASALVYGPDLVLTTARALGREDGLRVRATDGRVLEADVAGWDPATHLVLLRAPGLNGEAATPANGQVRVGHVVLALARSWSNAITASSGIVSIVGGPLPTSPGRSIERIIRTNAPMHSGFAGGALVDAGGGLIGICTAASIRGLRVVVPADIAWAVARRLAEHGTIERGYLGVAAQPVRLTGAQVGEEHGDRGLLVMNVAGTSPAESAGLLVGDLIVRFADEPVRSPVDLLERLGRHRVGESITMRVLRGATPVDIAVTVGVRGGDSRA
jgi:S1-C subfamily serine protease